MLPIDKGLIAPFGHFNVFDDSKELDAAYCSFNCTNSGYCTYVLWTACRTQAPQTANTRLYYIHICVRAFAYRTWQQFVSIATKHTQRKLKK